MPTGPAEEAALAQLDAILADSEARREEGLGQGRDLRVRGLAAIERIAPNSMYLEQARADLGRREGHAIHGVLDAVKALRRDLADGNLRPLAQLVHASLFEDFLEMAEELLDKDFCAPAAVIAGSVLEEHIHKLAQANEIALRNAKGRPLGFDAVATELTKKGTLLETERKTITSHYAIRTDAAHGRHTAVNCGDVERMIPSIREFISRHPA